MEASMFRKAPCPKCGENVDVLSPPSGSPGALTQKGKCTSCGMTVTRRHVEGAPWEMSESDQVRVDEAAIQLKAEEKGARIRTNPLHSGDWEDSWEGFLVYGDRYPLGLQGEVVSGVVRGDSEAEVFKKLEVLIEAIEPLP